MATLKEKIDAARTGQLSKEGADKLKQLILSGKLDVMAQQEGIDLTAFKAQSNKEVKPSAGFLQRAGEVAMESPDEMTALKGEVAQTGFTGDIEAPEREEIGINPSENADVNRGGTDTSFKDLPGNILPSTGALLENTWEAVSHPKQTAKALAGVAVGGVEKLIPGEQEQEKNFDAVTSFFKDRYGSLEGLKQTLVNDPVGFALDLASVAGAVKGGLRGAASAAAKQGDTALASTLQKSADVAGDVKAVNPFTVAGEAATSKPVKWVKDSTGKLKDITIENLSDLPANTLKTIREAPETFNKVKSGQITFQTVADTVKGKFDDLKSELSSAGQGYKAFRADKAESMPTPISKVDDYLGSQGLKVEKGIIKEVSPNSSNLSQADIAQAQEAYDIVKGMKTVTHDTGLNVRQKLDDLVDYAKHGDKGNSLVKNLRGVFDSEMKKTFTGLKELDAKFASKMDELNKVKDEFIDKKTGALKSNAISKIANSTKKYKDALIKKLEEIDPGIIDEVKMLKIYEGIVDPTVNIGRKVATTGASAGAGFLVGGPVGAILAPIVKFYVTQPEVVLKALETAGKAKGWTAATLKSAKEGLKMMSKMTPDQLESLGSLMEGLQSTEVFGDVMKLISLPERADVPDEK